MEVGERRWKAGRGGSERASSPGRSFVVSSVPPREWPLLRLMRAFRTIVELAWFPPTVVWRTTLSPRARVLPIIAGADTTRPRSTIPPLRNRPPSARLPCLSGSCFTAIVGYTFSHISRLLMRPALGSRNSACLWMHLHCRSINQLLSIRRLGAHVPFGYDIPRRRARRGSGAPLLWGSSAGRVVGALFWCFMFARGANAQMTTG